MYRLAGIVGAYWCTILMAPAAPAVTIDWSPVGNPGNAADVTGNGNVGYSYSIGTYDVTNSQYVEFLNAKDPTGANTLRLYNPEMTSAGGINYNAAAASGTKYSVKGLGNTPVNWVDWLDAIRFTNWLDNGQGNGSTESGAYTIPSETTNSASGITRNPGAQIYLPNVNEWYKAAYYNPATISYFLYPTSSNVPPTASGPTVAPNSANYSPSGANAVTHVGAYLSTTSPYGLFDTAGNVWQWNETAIGDYRGISGGSYLSGSDQLKSSFQGYALPTSALIQVGFRVASLLPPIPGDINHDGIVNSQDLAQVSANWLLAGSSVPGDANGDGIVNSEDLALISSNWLATTNVQGKAANVPEPSTLILAALGGLAMLRRKWR
jgi:sulfatase modifying factor 1